MYQHKTIDNQTIELPVGTVICVGRNYREHCAELANEVPKMPLLFMKSSASLVQTEQVCLKSDEPVHYETELALLIGKSVAQGELIDEQSCFDIIQGLGVALDLTKRGLQSKLKQKGHPWELAKAFDGSCPISGFVAFEQSQSPFPFSMQLNGDVRQQGNVEQMIHNIPAVMRYMNQHFSLRAGDIILTGTPEGVGEIAEGDKMELFLGAEKVAQFQFSYTD